MNTRGKCSRCGKSKPKTNLTSIGGRDTCESCFSKLERVVAVAGNVRHRIQAQAPFTVTLKAMPNPDFDQYGDIGVPASRALVQTLRAASKLCRDYIAAWNLGGGNWAGGQVYRDGDQIAQISYNGRVWVPGRYPTPEIVGADLDDPEYGKQKRLRGGV